MRLPVFVAVVAPLCIAASLLLSRGFAGDANIALTVRPAAVVPALPRYGLNLGGSGTWGAEQLRSNVLANPGFEPIIDRALVSVARVSNAGFADDTDWLARAPDFWAGASFDVRSGDSAGHTGLILGSQRASGTGPDEFRVGAIPAGLRTGDVISLTRDDDTMVAPHWWRGRGSVAASDEVPPGSEGRRSLRLMAAAHRPAEILHYLDNIGDRAGKLLPVNGRWKLAFWARRAGAEATLRVRFEREKGGPFLERSVSPGLHWKRYEFEFVANDTGPAGVLTLGITAERGEILIDEVYLGEADGGPGGFRRDVVATLATLNPGYLRDWQGQLGDTLANRLGGELSHRPVRYRPGDHESQFHYSIPDFLALCSAVGAQPWLIAPTTFSDDEWRRFGAYLRAAADQHGFREIHVEFGNENWNTIFRPAGIPDAAVLAASADRGFRLLREGSGNDPRLLAVINAQFVNNDGAAQLAKLSRQADRVSVAPYFMYRLDATATQEEAWKQAFAEDAKLLEQKGRDALSGGKRLSVYEVNFHTTLGTASSRQRNRVTAGAAGGTALARRLLQATLSGVREQAVYSFAGFDSYVGDSKELVRLWGVTRDLGSANRLRPTGLALAMLNRIAGGAAHPVDCSGNHCSTLTAVAFGGGKLAIASSGSRAQAITLKLSCEQGAVYEMSLLDASESERHNEDQAMPQVGIAAHELRCADESLRFVLPRYSLATLQPAAP